MATNIQELKLSGFSTCLPATADPGVDSYREIYEANRHRVYAWSFWMTGSELAADELMAGVFRRVFALSPAPNAEMIDRAFIAELRESMVVGTLTLHCAAVTETASVRRNTLRPQLEHAVLQLPATERLIYLMHDGEGYDHNRIAQTLGVCDQDSRYGLHQARLRLRELLAQMQA